MKVVCSVCGKTYVGIDYFPIKHNTQMMETVIDTPMQHWQGWIQVYDVVCPGSYEKGIETKEENDMIDEARCYPGGEVGDDIIVGNIKLDDTLLSTDDSFPNETKIMLRVDNDFFKNRIAQIVQAYKEPLRDGSHVYVAECNVKFRLVLLDGEFHIIGDVSNEETEEEPTETDLD